MHKFSITLYVYSRCMCRCEFFYFSIHQLNRLVDIFLLRGLVGLGNDEIGLQYFKIDITIEELKFAYFYGEIYRFTESHTFNSERESYGQ